MSITCLPSAFDFHSSTASANVWPCWLDDEVDVTRRAAERGRRLPGLDVVDRHRSTERHVQMRVRVDAARQDVLAARVDHLVRRDVQRLADQGDALTLDEDVGDVVVRRGDHAATLDQHRHAALLLIDYAEDF